MADYIVGLHYDDLPPAVVARAKELLVFHLGVALYGQGTRSGQQAVRLALELGGNDGASTIVGEQHCTGPLEAVFANSALVTSGGRHEVLFPSGVLPGATVHPAAWTVGELAGASGPDLLTAIAIGYDVMAKLHHGGLPYELATPRPTKAAVEPFGVAATSARLMRLSHQQTVYAMGHAGQSVMSIYEGGGAHGQAVMHPLAVRNGVLAAMLARAGFPAASTIIEGSHGVYRTFFNEDVPDVVRANLDSLGDDFEVTKARVARYPVSLANVLPIDLTKQLRAVHNLSIEQVAAVDLVLPKSREKREAIYGTYPKGPSTVIAIALTDGRFDPARFEEGLSAELLAVRDKVGLRFEDGHGFFYARVEITTIDGRRLAADADDPGDSAPINGAQWLTENGRAVRTETELTRLADLVEHLEDVDDVGEVLACTVPVDR